MLEPYKGAFTGFKDSLKTPYRPYFIKRASGQKEIILPYAYIKWVSEVEKRVCCRDPTTIALARTTQDKLFVIGKPLKRGFPMTDGW